MNHESQERAPRGRGDDGHEKNEGHKPGGNDSTSNRIEHPLRQEHDWNKCLFYIALWPSILTCFFSFLCAFLLSPDVPKQAFIRLSGFHFFSLLIFLFLLWTPSALAVLNWNQRFETLIVTLRSIFLVVIVVLLIPHGLLGDFLNFDESGRPLWRIYWGLIGLLSITYLIFSFRNNQRTATREVRMATDPQGRKHPDRWLWFDNNSVFLVLLAVIVVEFWFMRGLNKGSLDFSSFEYLIRQSSRLFEKTPVPSPDSPFITRTTPERYSTESISPVETSRADSSELTITLRSQAGETIRFPIIRDTTLHFLDSLRAGSGWESAEISLRRTKTQPYSRQLLHNLTLLCCSMLCGLFFFILACIPNRLMKATLIPVTFHERDVQGIVFKSYRYLYHFFWAILLKYPYLVVGGIILTIAFLATPAILTIANRLDILHDILAADEIILMFGVLIAWLSPIAFAVVTPDETFGEYFNVRLANQIMMVKNHIIFIGYGSLGMRVVDREINQMLSSKDKKMFFDIVTPDLRLEKLCSAAVVIEHDPRDAIYSGRSNLLGDYGVVSTVRRLIRTTDVHEKVIHAERRVLVPVLIGEAKDPFISSRVNLERAKLIICMVPEEESVQAIYERANKAHISTILCVTRSDQISYLTYRSRHRPIVLVYPKHNQGVTLGNRLWAAMLKVRTIRGMKGETWPRLLVIGNNKANHYMLETLWTNLPGNHHDRTEILRKSLAFIVTATEGEQAYPVLRDNDVSVGGKKKNKDEKKEDAFDKRWPATYVTGGRYPYPPGEVPLSATLNVPTRVVNAADIRALESCIEQHQPEILVINHEDVDRSLLMLSRCMRVLERLKISQPAEFHLPLLLLAAASGNEWEQLSLGDASRYYDAQFRLHKEDLASDMSYPGHARYEHTLRELVGESISDSHADSEEVIAGAHSSMLGPAPRQFIEINACLPNRPGTLANYVARLAGLEFQSPSKSQLDEMWRKTNDLPAKSAAYLPSFQYLRNVMLDPERKGFALTGYATLAPVIHEPAKSQGKEDAPLVVRVFANDGRDYVEREIDLDELTSLSQAGQIEEPAPPGVPQVIDELTNRASKRHNTVGEFHQVMLDPQKQKGKIGEYACPGMTICRIAALQDYVVASNDKRLQRLAIEPNRPIHRDAKLLHARNYFCCTGMQQAERREIPTPDSPYARIFCCCQGSHDPGMIAMVLNTLLFRTKDEQTSTSGKKTDFVINIDYFKDVSCQNSHFTLNRLFGFFQKSDQAKLPEALPLRVLRILPIGGPASAQQWYYYSRMLHQFLNTIDSERQYKFYWLDGEQQPRKDQPDFSQKDRRELPIALVIKLKRTEEEKHREREKHGVDHSNCCDLCGVQSREYDCRKLRVWI